MRTRLITTAIALSMIFGTSRSSSAQTPVKADGGPAVTLLVNMNKLTVNRREGSISFYVDAVASAGFNGVVSGTVTVSQPVNPSGVLLTAGSDGKTVPFTLNAGQKTSETTPPRTLIFTVTTSPKNPTSGTILYIVQVDPSDKFTTGEPQRVEVTTTP